MKRDWRIRACQRRVSMRTWLDSPVLSTVPPNGAGPVGMRSGRGRGAGGRAATADAAVGAAVGARVAGGVGAGTALADEAEGGVGAAALGAGPLPFRPSLAEQAGHGDQPRELYSR